MNESPRPEDEAVLSEFSWLAVLGMGGIAFILTAYAWGKGDSLDVSGTRLQLAAAIYVLLTFLVPVYAEWEKRRLSRPLTFRASVVLSLLIGGVIADRAESSREFEYWMYVVGGGFMAGATVMGIRTGLARMRGSNGGNAL